MEKIINISGKMQINFSFKLRKLKKKDFLVKIPFWHQLIHFL